jgi:hypothetical protein
MEQGLRMVTVASNEKGESKGGEEGKSDDLHREKSRKM